MLSREGRQHMTIAPRLAIWPGLCLTTVVLPHQQVPVRCAVLRRPLRHRGCVPEVRAAGGSG